LKTTSRADRFVRGPSPKNLLRGILSGTYTPPELREFAQLCYAIALPLIRKKISLGKLNPEAMGLKESDLAYDCLVDLFRRDQKEQFCEIQSFFQKEFDGSDGCSDEAVLAALRRLVFGKVNNNMTRLYAELDPTLGRILRNIKLCVERNGLFKQFTRFGEVYLIPARANALLHLPPIPFEVIQQEFSRLVLIHDNVPTMLKKLYTVLIEQARYQRSVALVSAALLFKEIYCLGWETEKEKVVETSGSQLEDEEIIGLVDKVCSELRTELHPTYVGNGKKSEELFRKYIEAVREILISSLTSGGSDGVSYYDCLREQIPGLTKESYRSEHRTVLEYLGKVAKLRLKEEWRKI